MTSSFVPLATPLALAGEPAEKRRLPLVEQFLREQQSLTAVERFAQRHVDADRPALQRYYQDLIPASAPQPGQQYAFEVDLDACTGCKACVAACHNLNGLDEGETWRSVGLLHGGTTAAPVQQSVTTACHHCLDPACLNGCPVLAYEKDPVTGIVKHLDDQCIGCQYCTFMCPYDVPQYNAARGIVRKCDMCQDRLAAGEAPACVQACPNEAIAIGIVERHSALESTQAEAFVPGAPSPAMTVPTTVYKTERALPRNLLPANFYVVKPSHHHAPLVVMLVLTQLSAGAFCVDAIGSSLVAEEIKAALGRVHSLVAVVMGLAALGASVLHLGRPLYAFRALLGLRTSWMSREILCFGLFAFLAMLYAASFWAPPLAHARASLGVAAAVMGAAGVACSVLIYHATRRAWWSAPGTAFKFILTAAILGLATTGLTLSIVGRTVAAGPLSSVGSAVARLLVVCCALKAVGELLVLRHLKGHRQSEWKRSALLLVRDLRGYALARGALMAAGIIAASYGVTHSLSIAGAAIVMAILLAGELLERMLFFAALSSPGMPGNLT